MLGLITWLDEMMAMVCPSLGPRTSCAVPVTPPGPGRFSITTGCRMLLASSTLMARATVSTVEPVVSGTMILSALPLSWAWALGPVESARTDTSEIRSRRLVRRVVVCFMVVSL